MGILTKLQQTDDGPVIAKGPTFSHAGKVVTDIDGTSLSFRAPKHSPRRASMEFIQPEPNYNLDKVHFRSYSTDKKGYKNWEEYELFRRSWAFHGPWFSGVKAHLDMTIGLIKPLKNMDYSFFHPRAFESTVTDYLTFKYSDKINGRTGQHLFITPVNWQPLNHLSVNAVRLKVIADERYGSSTDTNWVFFPITDEIMAYIYLDPSQLLTGSQEEKDNLVSRAPLYELMGNIIDSIQLELSPEAQAQQKAAIEGLDDTSLVKEFLPLQWDNINSDNTLKEIEN